MQELWLQSKLTMTGQSRTTTSRRKLGIAYAWWNRTVRRPTPMTTWKPRSTQCTWDSTLDVMNTWMCAQCCKSFSVLGRHHSLHTHLVAQDVRVFVSSHPCMKWAFTLRPWTLHSIQLPLLIPHQSQAVLAALQLPRGQVVRSPVLLRQGDGVNWRVLLQHMFRAMILTRLVWSTVFCNVLSHRFILTLDPAHTESPLI